MRACTAVVTEISYNEHNTIDADISFLSREEWKAEIGVLLDDLIGEDGHPVQRLRGDSEAGVAWQKLHAVCPTLAVERVVQLTPDQIIDRDQRVAKVLGTTKKISCPNSRQFAKEIGKYIDSKEKKKGSKDKKTEEQKRKESEPAFWPLIKQVRVRCHSKALSTGAILVDLPGVADANAARSVIAKDYMKLVVLHPMTRMVSNKTSRRCQAIWILAPITVSKTSQIASSSNPCLSVPLTTKPLATSSATHSSRNS